MACSLARSLVRHARATVIEAHFRIYENGTKQNKNKNGGKLTHLEPPCGGFEGEGRCKRKDAVLHSCILVSERVSERRKEKKRREDERRKEGEEGAPSR